MNLLSLITALIFVLAYTLGWWLGGKGGEVFLTIFSGVFVYVLGQIIVKIVIDPVQEMKKTIGEISHTMNMYANVFLTPGDSETDVMEKTCQHLRDLSSQLHSHLKLIPKYDHLRKIFFLPLRKDVLTASSALIDLTNEVFKDTFEIREKNASRWTKVCDSLDIYLQRWPSA